MILYNKLFALMDSKGIKKVELRERGIHPRIFSKLSRGELIRSDTIDQLCSLLECQPGDLMEYVPSEHSALAKDHLTLADISADERAELIDGVLCELEKPSARHQEVVNAIADQLQTFLEGKSAGMSCTPMRTCLFSRPDTLSEEIDTVVYPDILVACDGLKMDGGWYSGAPDMVIEVLSPDTQRRDRIDKLKLYERAKVKEYWLVDPDAKTVQVYLLEGETYQLTEVYTAQNVAKVNVLPGCFVELSKVFGKK